MKKIYRAMAGFFLAALLAVGLASLFTTGSGTDGASTKKPEFSMQALLDGTFISQLETYYANTFPMRDTLLKANGKQRRQKKSRHRAINFFHAPALLEAEI